MHFPSNFLFKNDRKSILLIEINPASFADLLFQLGKFDRNIILLNRRRSAVWNLDSIHALRNGKCKLVNFKKILANEKNQILKLQDTYIEKLEKILDNAAPEEEVPTYDWDSEDEEEEEAEEKRSTLQVVLRHL